MKWIGEHRISQNTRFGTKTKVYLPSILDPGSDTDKFLVAGVQGLLGYRTGAEVLADIGGLPTSTNILAFDGSTANGVCTYKDADEISVESTLTYDSETLTMGADDNGTAFITRLPHSDDDGGKLQVAGGSATAGQTNKAGGQLRLAGGLPTGSGVGGDIKLYTSPAGASGTVLRAYDNTWTLSTTGLTTLPGGLAGPTDGDLSIVSDGNVTIGLDNDNDETNQLFKIQYNGGTDSLSYNASRGNLELIGGASTYPICGFTNTADDDVGMQHNWTKNRGAAGEDGDRIASLSFRSYNDAGTPALKNFARIFSEIADATAGEEAGNLTLQVSSYDGVLTNGLQLLGDTDADGEVDVTIGAGAASTTTVAGTLTMGSTAAIGNTGLLTVGTQTGITATANLVTVGTIGTGTWQGTAVASAYLDADTAHLTTDQTFTGIKQVNLRKFPISSGTDGDAIGDVVYFGGTTSMTVGTIYHYKSDGTWEVANANAVATSDGLLGVALGAASDTNGMLLRGMVTLDHDPGAVGDVLYLSNTAGDASSTAPSDNNDIVRVIGYCLNASSGQIWFNPDNTFVEVTA